MATLRQIEAARVNGSKSRGPVTAEGKARTALNSAKHGLYSHAIVLNNEDPEAYAAMLAEFIGDWTPVGITEIRLVNDIVNATWRIDRLTAFEAAALDLETDRMRNEVDAAFEEIDESTRATLAFNSLISNNRVWEAVQAGIRTQYRIRDRAVNQLLRLQKERRKNQPPPEPHGAPAKATPLPVNIEMHRSKPGTSGSTTTESDTISFRTDNSGRACPTVRLEEAGVS